MNPIRTAAALLMLVCSALLPVIAQAATFTVDSTVDDVDGDPGDGVCASTGQNLCTLRAAIQEANALGGTDTIRLRAGLHVLTIAGRSENAGATGDLDITGDITIIGAGARKTYVNGGKIDRVFHVMGPISVTMTDMTVQNGLAADDGSGDVNFANGGGILNGSASTLTLKGITLSNNAALGVLGGKGGGIHNSGTLTITKSTLSNSSVSNNAALGGGVAGGGIFNAAGTLRITAAAILNNVAAGAGDGFGGGVMNYATSEIRRSTISNNTVSVQGQYGEGGGLNNNGTMTIRESTISGNMAQGGFAGDGGGIANGGGLTIETSIISGNTARGPFAGGGGIASFAGDTVITGSTLSNNAASAVSGNPGRGGGIFLGNTGITVRGASKILRNFATDRGGGICYGGTGTGSISAESTVAKNIPDNIYPAP